MASFSVEVDGRTVPGLGRLGRRSRAQGARSRQEDQRQRQHRGRSYPRRAGAGGRVWLRRRNQAAVRAQFDKRNRKELPADIREDIDSFRSSNPALAYGAELGGAVGTGLIPGLGAARLGALASRPLLRAGAVNAATGAVAGAGMAEDDKLSGALGGVALGGAIGAGRA